MHALNRTTTGVRVALRRLGACVAVATTAAALSVTSAPLAGAEPVTWDKPTVRTVTFTSTAEVASWTVPGDASTTIELMISAAGGQGGRGGYDGGTVPAPGGYVGVVSGTLSVAGGTTLQIAVGAGGANGANSVTSGPGGNGGSNTFGGYAGGKGGTTGTAGAAGSGGGGGAATVIHAAGATIVAGGAGGGGGSGSSGVLSGRAPEAASSSAHASATTNGTAGGSVPTSGAQLAGGGAGGGGGGAMGGAGGHTEYGSGTAMEWFGYGGYPGANATGGYSTLDASYQYYSGNGANGSVTIAYVDGPPAAAQNVIGRAGSAAGSVELSWQAPVNFGLSAVTGYLVQSSDDGGSTWGDATLSGAATLTSGGGGATVTGLAAGEDYLFRVAAQNGYSGGAWSVPSAPVTAAAGDGVVPVSPWGTGGADVGGVADAGHAYLVLGDGTITVTWDSAAPAKYTVHVHEGAGAEANTSPQTCGGGDCTVSGLDPSSDYTVVIETPSAETAPPVAVAPYQSAGSNSTPGGWTGVPGEGAVMGRNEDGTITVSWDPPANAPATDYLLHVYDDDGEIAGSPFPCKGLCTSGYLDPATTYDAALEFPNRTDPSGPVRPADSQGWTAPQDPARAVTGAPTNLGTAARDGALGVSFTAPAAQPAGNAILYYQYSLDGGATWANSGTFTGPAQISGLTNGTSYSVMLRAMTLEGPGTASGAVAGTPRGYPSAPHGGSNPANVRVSAVSGSNYTITWDPYRPNGAAVSGYSLTAFDAAMAGQAVKTCAASGTASSCTLAGITGVVYLSLQAQNAVGASPRSEPRIMLDASAAAPGAPGKPTVVGADLTWTAPSGTADAYVVQYTTDGGTTWTTVAPTSGPTTSGGVVTAGIGTLAGGLGYVFRVQALNGALSGPWSEQSDAATVKEAVTPVLEAPKSIPGGFTVQITPYDAAFGWSVMASSGAATIDGAGLVTVTGLSASQTATLTVTATGFGTGGRSASTSGTALDGIAPVLGAATPTAGGFTLRIANWDKYKNGRYGPGTVFTPVLVANPNSVTPVYSGPDASGLIAVTGIGDGHQITLAYQVASNDHTRTQSNGVVGKSLQAAVKPTLSAPTSTSDGFTVTIQNLDPNGNTTYRVAVSDTSRDPISGAQVGRNGETVTVSGLSAGATARVTVTAQVDGSDAGSAFVDGTALAGGSVPIFGAVTRASAGFTTAVTTQVGYSGAALSVMVSGGATVSCGGGASKVNGPVDCAFETTITVSGVASGKTATVTAYVWDATHGVVSGTVKGQALYVGVAPEFANYTQTADGFTVDIDNWNTFKGAGADGSGTSYAGGLTTVSVTVHGVDGSIPTITCDGGATTCDTLGHIVVTGLTSDESTTGAADLTVTVIEDNHTMSSATMTGQAEPLNTHFSGYTQTADGYTVQISDFSSTDYTYTVELTGAVPDGAVVKCGTDATDIWVKGDAAPETCANQDLIVTGLSAAGSATVVVKANVVDVGGTGLNPWTSTFEGFALPEFTLAVPARVGGGFTTFIAAGYDSTGATTYTVTLAAVGGTDISKAQVARDGSLITVSGLGAGAKAKVTVDAQLGGGARVTRDVEGQAKDAGVKPVLTVQNRTSSGFTATITNADDFSGYDSDSPAGTRMVTVMVGGGASVQCADNDTPVRNGPVVCKLGDTITVSGVASGKMVALTAAVIDRDHLDVQSDELTGQAQFAGVAPEFGTVTRTATGFTTSISNWDTFKGTSLTVPGTNAYVAANTTVTAAVASIGGSTPVISGPDGTGKITVTGLTAAQQAKVIVSVYETGNNHTDSFAYRIGQALAAGVTPSFDPATSLIKSFTVKLATYDASSSYTITATEGDSGTGAAIPAKNVSFDPSTQLITVTGLADGAQATVHVHVEAAGSLPADGSTTGKALLTPSAPVLAVTGNTAGGFTAKIVNWAVFANDVYGGGTTLAAVVTPQSGDPAPTVDDNHDGTYAVTGVPTGHSATLTVTARQADHPDALSAAVTGTALYAGVAPTLGAPARTADGFLVPITNFALYTAAGDPTEVGNDASKFGDAGQFATAVTAVSAGGVALGNVRATVLEPSGVLQVSGLAYGQTATVKLTAGDGLSLHLDATSDAVTGQALFAPTSASFGAITATLDSITVRISNFDRDAGYLVTSSAGVVSRSGSVITVTDLLPGQSATITVAATTPGHVQGMSSVTGTALKVADQPGSSSATQREGGFSARITPFDKDASYAASIAGASGARVTVKGDTVTVTGMKPGDTVTVTITQTKDGYAPITTTITYTLPADAGDAKDPSGGATPPGVPELKAGQTSVTVNGVPVEAKTSFGPNGVTVSWQGMSMTAVQLVGGAPVPPGADSRGGGVLTVSFTGTVKVDVSGFAPGSRVQLWAFSTPLLLGTFTVQPNTSGIITVVLPGAVLVGDHTLIASGVSRAGEHVTMATAMRVTPLADGQGVPDPDATDGREQIAYTGTHTFDELRIAAGLLVVGMGLVALTFRRRRPDPALAQVGVAGGFGPEPEASGPVVVAYGTWKRSPDSTPAAAAVSAAMTAVPSTGYARAAGSQTGAVPTGPTRTATAAPSGQPTYRFIPPRTAPSAEWISLRFSLGLIEA